MRYHLRNYAIKMKKKILDSLLFILFISGCQPDKLKISFEGINYFDSAVSRRYEFIKQTNKKNYDREDIKLLINEIDSLYWEKIIQILDSTSLAIYELKISPSQRILRINELKEDFSKSKITGYFSNQNEEDINKILEKIAMYLVKLRHLQAWDNRRVELITAVKDFSRNKFKGFFTGKIDLEIETINLIDSVEISDEAEEKKMNYRIKYLKIYKGDVNRYEAYGIGEWQVKCHNNSSYLEVINLCPDCYKEIKIDDN